MTINLIANVYFTNNKFAIGKDNQLLFLLKKDLHFFKSITTNSLSNSSKLSQNVLVMGYNTWKSIGSKPLPNRINIILSHSKQKNPTNNTYFMNLDQFITFYNKNNPNVFVIGGSQIYDLFLNHLSLFPNKIYLTHVYNHKNNLSPTTFLDCLNDNYKLVGVSEKYTDNNLQFRILQYHFSNDKSQEFKYINLLKSVIDKGILKPERTGVGTISSFGHQLEFDISTTVPLLTTKRIPWKSCIEELLWFLRGDTNAKILQNKGVKIWDGNSSRNFLDSRELYDYPDGVLGPIYGWQWRFFGADYHNSLSDTSKIDVNQINGFDQISYIIHELKTNPHSRRLVVSSWNPNDLDKMALPPCHYTFQFYVREINKQKFLDCHFIMRSTDTTLGLPFNLFSYTVLTYIIALKVGMHPGKLIYTGSDVHIYQNHNQQVIEQLQRTFRPLPKLILNPQIQYKMIKDIIIEDFDVVGYFPHPSIKMDMAI